MMWKVHRMAFIGMLLLILFSMMTALAAANTVPTSRLDDDQVSIGLNDLKPAQCASITVTNLITTPGFLGIYLGTNQNDLIIGNSGGNTFMGAGGNDCMMGGGGNDTFYGGSIFGDNGAADVCIGGPGTDSFSGCETAIQ
jgi:Ca2+-binding RTX toxin-like protein